MKDSEKLTGLFLRYASIFILGLGNLYIFYKILTPLTIGAVNFILSVFINTQVEKNIIFLSTHSIEIVPACVAGSAFYLLTILILSAGNLKPKVRLKAAAFALLTLFAFNVLRIAALSPIALLPSFEIIHWIFWHIISTIAIVAIWILTVKIFKIDSYPVYTDFKYIKGLILIKPRKKTKRKKKHK